MRKRRTTHAEFIALSVVVFAKNPDILYKLVRNFFLSGYLRLKELALKARLALIKTKRCGREEERKERTGNENITTTQNKVHHWFH